MEMESGVLAALTLGFLLGLKHATDADHVVAVSTIVSEYRNLWRGIWIGGSWGLGHTTPLLGLGIVILAFKEVALDQYATMAPLLEFGVGVMLLYLGVQVFLNLRRGSLHVHEHTHDKGPHVHIHATHDPSADPEVEASHGFLHIGKPAFRVKSYAVGLVHGVAGSAAIMLVLLPQLSSFWVGLGYLLMFGIGTILSMAAVTLLLGVPFAVAKDARRLNHGVSAGAGVLSIVLGVALMTDFTFGTNLVPF